MLFNSTADAQVADDWQVLRIFVPEEEVGSLVPNDYNPVEIEDLANALSREATRRTRLQSSSHIAEALYVVRCSAESLISDQSRWFVKTPVSNATLALEEISVALRNSGSTPADDKPLLPNLRFSPDGVATLSKIVGDTNYWFGLSSGPAATSSNQSIYELRLPAATMAQMLISAPESIQITSPDVIVTPVANPREHLPDTWPSLATADSQHWFLVQLSGKSRLRLIADVSERKGALEFQHFVRRSSIAYSASEKGLDVTADFELERLPTTSSVKIEIGKPLRVRTLTVNGTAADYRMAKSDEDGSALELLLSDVPEGSARVRIEAVSDIVFPFDDLLPAIKIARAFSWEGRTSLVTEDALISDQLVFASRIEFAKAKLESATIGKRWVADWIGVPPQMRASIGRTTQVCEADSFTRLTVQEDWIAATTSLRIACNSLESNELRLQVGEGWFIDDLSIEKSDLPITSHLPDGEAGEVVLTWDRMSNQMSINLQVVAHLPRATDIEQFSLRAPRVVTVIGGLQRDHYAIEQTGRYQIQASPILQRLGLSESKLLPWQMQLLSRSSTTQLFQGLGDSVPPIVMSRSSGTYTAKATTVARNMDDQLRVTYAVDVLPSAGAIDMASCVLSIPAGLANPIWRVTHELNGEEIQVAKAVVNASREGVDLDSRNDVRFDFQLPNATSSEFVLKCELLIPIQGSAVVNLPLVTMPVATEARIILPRNFELPFTPIGIFALPSNICCDSSEFAKELDNEADSMVGYRYDSSVVSSVNLRPASLQSDHGAWIWSDTTEHWLYNDGRVAHQSELEIFAPENLTLNVDLPPGWVANRILLDGSVSAVSQQLQRVSIAIAQGEHVHLSLRASSQTGLSSWLTQVQLPKPLFSLESLSSSESLWLQPGRVSSNEILRDVPLSFAGRLNPSGWWQWLTPTPMNTDEGSVDSQGWRKIPLHFNNSNLGIVQKPNRGQASGSKTGEADELQPLAKASVSKALLIDRSSLSAMCIAILLAGSGLTFSLLGARVTWWWICLSMSIAAVLLVPSNCVAGAQLILLCFVGGAFARLIRIATHSRASRSGIIRHGSTAVRASATASLFLLIICSGGVGSAQESLFRGPSEKYPRTYGVLIPLNAEGKLSAKHVYAPRKLMNLLNNSDSQDSEEQLPQILGARYMLKLSRGTSLTSSYVQEFTAEFDLLFNSTEFPIRLPFKSTQLQLLRGSVSGQGVPLLTRLQQSADTITYRPPETGRVRLRLQLIPTTHSNIVDRTGMEVGIPRIASSVLEVLADDTLDVNIDSIGLVRRMTASSWSAELGPTDALRVDWPTRPQRTPMPNQAVTQSDTWLHVSEGQIVADCQIRINGARSLPKQLHLVLDAGWEPVGTEWNDCELLSSEPSAVGNRRIYLVNRESLSDRAVLRVLTVPRNGETVSTLAIPFFSLSESTLSGRTLAISVAGKSRWKVVGNESWNRVNASITDLDWDTDKPTASELWRVPSGSLSGSLQRIPSDSIATVEESFDLQLLSTQTVLNYRANWSQATDAQVLRLEVPLYAETRSVRVNSLEAEYLLSERGGRKFLLVNVARGPAEIRFLEVQMQLSAPTGEPVPLPRIVLKDAFVAKSLYQVNSGAEFVCNLIDDEKLDPELRLKFTQPVADPTLMLSTLTTPVGAVDLANSNRESTNLPTLYQVHKRLPVNVIANAMALTRSEQGWRATVEVLVSAKEPTEFVFFDVPSTIRDLIESSGSPYRVASSGAAGRSTLCLIPQVAENGASRAKFDFRLPGLSAAQSLSIPDVFFLGETASRPVVALPSNIDDQPVRWLRAGRRLPDDWLSKSGLTFDSVDLNCYEIGESQPQLTWRVNESENNPAEILFAWAVIDEDTQGNTIGAINYWIDPNSHLDVSLSLPKGAQLVGIQSGSNGAVWHSDKVGSVRVVMQPNYMYVQLRVLLRWPKNADASTPLNAFSVQLPEIDAAGLKQLPIAVISRSKLVSSMSKQNDAHATELTVRARMDASQFDALLANRWKELLVKSQAVISGLRDDELASWMRNWTPEVIGLSRLQSLVNNGDTGRETVGGFWKGYLEQALASKTDQQAIKSMRSTEADVLFTIDPVLPHSATIADLPSAEAEWYLADFDESERTNVSLRFVGERQHHATGPLVIAALAMTAASSLMYFLFRRLRQRAHEILATHAWLYWTFLAALAWLLLPVAWPSVVIAVNSFGMLTGQLMDSRRRQLAMRR